jgi:hypothetical protein
MFFIVTILTPEPLGRRSTRDLCVGGTSDGSTFQRGVPSGLSVEDFRIGSLSPMATWSDILDEVTQSPFSPDPDSIATS